MPASTRTTLCNAPWTRPACSSWAPRSPTTPTTPTKPSPLLAAHVAGKDLPSHRELRWITPKPTPKGGWETFEVSTFAMIADGQVVYREGPRDEPPPQEPHAALLDRSTLETLIGEYLSE